MSAKILSLKAVGVGAVVLDIAARHQLFAKHGVDVDLIPVTGTKIPDITDAIPMAYIGAPAALMRAASGTKLKIIASFDQARLSSQLVVSPAITAPNDLRGKRLGARVTGAAMWLHTVLALEKLGLDAVRDEIEIAEIGDPAEIMTALESQRIDGAVLSEAQCQQLKSSGFNILFDFGPLSTYGAPDALAVMDGFLKTSEQPKRILAAMIEAVAFSASADKEIETLVSVKETLGIADDSAARKGLRELIKTMAKVPYPSVDRLSDMQRMMGQARPNVLSLDLSELIDNGLVRELDVSGSIEQTFSSYGREGDLVT